MIAAKDLPLRDLVSLGVRLFNRIESRMTADPDGLAYGWDWQTAGVYYPFLVRRFGDLRQEWNDRGRPRLTA